MNQMTAVRMQSDYDGGGRDVAVLDSVERRLSGNWSGDLFGVGGAERQDAAFSMREPELIVSISQDSELVQGSQESSLQGISSKGFEGDRRSGGGANGTNRIALNVGGQWFETSVETLSFDGCSMLAAMVTRHMRTEGEVIFIDRDPVRFRHVLNYLRSQTIWLDNLPDLRAVQEEADFFNLSGLYGLCEERIQHVLRVRNEHHEVLDLKSTLNSVMEELRETIKMVTWLDNQKPSLHRKEPISGVRRRRLEYESLIDPIFRMDEDF